MAENEVDRVAQTSLRADGTADQTAGYEVITDADEVRASADVGTTTTLDARTHDELDALADSNDVDDYPRSGTKDEKASALQAAGVTG